ncbi:thioredoxin family protein [Microbacterium sp. MPKO10]|uniref:thioredoxin family protein n=1 Tax=Microbacterium sp. MPKO10 TaxID=2989818 RepID=UPI00223571E4|nr:thioredoxin family protein [Microbacterium sp. MPKO10]MCW4456693.1 thioredoxin family protein [Microbacterium sp. MPKO10]
MDIVLYTSAFCAPCTAARRAVAEVERLVPVVTTRERDVAAHPESAEADSIRATPTLLLRSPSGREVFRAEGAPRVNQLLTAVALHIDDA